MLFPVPETTTPLVTDVSMATATVDQLTVDFLILLRLCVKNFIVMNKMCILAFYEIHVQCLTTFI